MLDRTIPFYNTILRCDRYLTTTPILHNGYEFRMYQDGDERKWAQLEYEIGDFVSKPVTGICKIENILYLNPQDEKNDKLYYLMKPVEDEKEKIYVPVSNSDSRLRLCLAKEEAWNLIKRIPDIPTAWTNNEKMREQNYKEAVRANNPEALVDIIKMIYQRKQKRLAQGKKCTATDARYFQIAENLLYMELGVALEKPKQEIYKTIIDYIDQNKID